MSTQKDLTPIATLSIGKDVYKVVVCKLPKNIYGLTHLDEGLIQLSSKLPLNRRDEILGHEIMHVWLHQTGWGTFLTAEQLEAACDLFGSKLAYFCKRNQPWPVLSTTKKSR